jgi:hypothetical protein
MNDTHDHDHDHHPPDPYETRQVLRQVAAYREVCESVRRKSTGSLIFGGIMLAIWYFALQGMQFTPFGLVYLGLALLELSVGLLNRVWPTAEGVLLDGLVLFAFGGWNVARAALIWFKLLPGGLNPVLLVFGIIWLLQGLQTIRSYFQLRRAMPATPTREHLRWFDGLVRELRDADPRDDPKAVAFPTEPFLTGKLLGDTAMFLDQSGAITITVRQDVNLERVESSDPERPPRGYLSIDGSEFPPFKLSDVNWNNYVAWKREGGEDPLADRVPTVNPRSR